MMRNDTMLRTENGSLLWREKPHQPTVTRYQLPIHILIQDPSSTVPVYEERQDVQVTTYGRAKCQPSQVMKSFDFKALGMSGSLPMSFMQEMGGEGLNNCNGQGWRFGWISLEFHLGGCRSIFCENMTIRSMILPLHGSTLHRSLMCHPLSFHGNESNVQTCTSTSSMVF